MAQPKRKTSKSKSRMRRRSHTNPLPKLAPCAQCGESHQPHRVCPACGYYHGRQVLTVESI